MSWNCDQQIEGSDRTLQIIARWPELFKLQDSKKVKMFEIMQKQKCMLPTAGFYIECTFSCRCFSAYKGAAICFDIREMKVRTIDEAVKLNIMELWCRRPRTKLFHPQSQPLSDLSSPTCLGTFYYYASELSLIEILVK